MKKANKKVKVNVKVLRKLLYNYADVKRSIRERIKSQKQPDDMKGLNVQKVLVLRK